MNQTAVESNVVGERCCRGSVVAHYDYWIRNCHCWIEREFQTGEVPPRRAIRDRKRAAIGHIAFDRRDRSTSSQRLGWDGVLRKRRRSDIPVNYQHGIV